MKKKIIEIIPFLFILIFSGIFFRQTLIKGKLPIPSDTLVGMYHPYLDYIAKEYPAGLPFKNFLITDPIRQQIPWRKLTIDTIKKGTFDAWNAYSFSGTPLSTNIQSGFFYPLNVLFLLVPFPIAWTMLIVLQQILSGVFFYLFLRKSMTLSSYASLFGALCFMFSGFSIMWLTWGTIGQTLMWLPLLLVLSDVLLSATSSKKRIIISISIGLTLSTQYFAGHSQIFLYSSILFAVYWLYRLSFSQILIRKGAVVGMVGGVGLFVLLSSVHWIPFLLDMKTISRLQDAALVTKEGFFIPYQNLVQFLIPDFFGNPATLNYWGIWNYAEFCGYIGIPGLFFVLYSLFSHRKKDMIFWFLTVSLGLLFALPTAISLVPYRLQIPIVSSLQPTRLLSLVDVGLCVLAGLGLDAWLIQSRKRFSIFICTVLAVVFGIIWYLVKVNPFKIIQENLDVTGRNSIFPTVIFGLVVVVLIIRVLMERIAGKKSMIPIFVSVVLLIGISFYDLSRFGWKFTPFTDSALFFPKTEIITFLEKQTTPFRITAVDDRILPPNVSAYYGIESIGGYDPLYEARYEKFIAAMERGEPNITPPFGFNRIIAPKNITSPLFQLLGVRYVLSLSDISDSRFMKVKQEGQTRLYEYRDVLPRVYLLHNIEVIYDEESCVKALYAPTFQIGKDGIVEEPVSVVSSPLVEGESAVITDYEDAILDISVETKVERVLFIGNIFHRKWRTFIDGKTVPFFRVNYLFIGIIVPKGVHSVQLRYE
jgi:hypothetical protein